MSLRKYSGSMGMRKSEWATLRHDYLLRPSLSRFPFWREKCVPSASPARTVPKGKREYLPIDRADPSLCVTAHTLLLYNLQGGNNRAATHKRLVVDERLQIGSVVSVSSSLQDPRISLAHQTTHPN